MSLPACTVDELQQILAEDPGVRADELEAENAILKADNTRLKLEIEEHAAVDYYSSRFKAAEKTIQALKEENTLLRGRVERFEGINVKHEPLQVLQKAD